MKKIIYKAEFTKNEKKIVRKKLDLSKYDADIQEFLTLSVAYGDRVKTNIVIKRGKDAFVTEIDLELGLFTGNYKKDFLELATKSNNFLIMPMAKVTGLELKLSAYYNID